MESIKTFVFAVVLLCFQICVNSTELDSTLLDAMDKYVLAMESERASVDFTKEIEVSEPLAKRLSACEFCSNSITILE